MINVAQLHILLFLLLWDKRFCVFGLSRIANGAKSWLMVPRNPFLTVVQLVSRTFSNSHENNGCLLSVSRFADVFPQQSLCCVPFAVELGVCGCGNSAAGCRDFLPHLTSYLQDGLQYMGRCLGKQMNTYISSQKERKKCN